MKKEGIILPPAKLGIVGGGQLGKMLALEAKRMGYTVIVLESNSYAPAAQVADKTIIGSLLDGEQIKKLAKESDVLTYEFEFINAEVLCELEEEGYKVFPSGRTLKKIQNKYIQKSLFKEARLPVPKLKKISSWEDIYDSINEFGFPIILKSCTGGYDGKGNFVIKDENDIEKLKEKLDVTRTEFMVEECINFVKELSIVVVRGQSGEVKYFPVVENTHENSILKITKAPADISNNIKEKIIDVTNQIMNLFNDVGVFCVELFLTQDQQIYINEVAPRPHNSGHYTIEACVSSQFEQQLRAVTGLPLGSTKMVSPAVMGNFLGKSEVTGDFVVNGVYEVTKMENVHFHFYGKKFIEFEKKIGHITVLDNDINKAEEKAIKALKILEIGEEL